MNFLIPLTVPKSGTRVPLVTFGVTKLNSGLFVSYESQLHLDKG